MGHLCPAHAQYTSCWGTAPKIPILINNNFGTGPQDAGSAAGDGGSAAGPKDAGSAESCAAPAEENVVLKTFQQINDDLGCSSIVSEKAAELLAELSAAPPESRNPADFVLDPAQLDKEPIQRSKSLAQVFKTGSEFSIFKFIEQQRLSTVAGNKLIKTITKVISLCVVPVLLCPACVHFVVLLIVSCAVAVLLCTVMMKSVLCPNSTPELTLFQMCAANFQSGFRA